jgi:predicted flap endonuclease-1-like 5' DNA nuclease
MTALVDIEGIGPVYAQKIQTAGLKKCGGTP